MQKKLLFIVNPVAGKKKIKNYLLDVLDIFAHEGYASTVMVTGRRGDATRFAALGGEYDLVVCSGGDGTLNEVISGLLKNNVNVPLGYIPCGSTNDFASSMGISSDPRVCAKSMINATPLPLDIGSFNNKYFTYIASFGAFTAASYSAPQDVKNFWGPIAYLFEGIKDLQSIKPYRVKVVSEGNVFENDYVFGAVANTTKFGGIVRFKDELVSLNDGLFEVLLVKMPKTIVDLNAIISALSSNKFDKKHFDFFKSSKLTVSPSESIAWSLDGEYVHPKDDIEIENLHSVIEFCK
ncbi:MAG: diacylglycerol kinase family lipid kinase [Clostridia bacterium]|nr:diacylglycerol kinase family lipid kinase [Clostridia bacterium]